jgi:serine/threonine-protein kinase
MSKEKMEDWKIVRETRIGGRRKASIVKREDGALKMLVTANDQCPIDEFDHTCQRLKRNSEMLLGLEHSGIAKIEKLTVDNNGRPVVIMDYFRGEPVSMALETADLPMMLAHFKQIVEGVAFIHDLGLLHLNLKTKYILTDFYHGQTKIISWWGLHTKEDIAARDIAYSLPYVAPEIILGGHIDFRADLYSLGAILYEIWAGYLPYPNRGDVAGLKLTTQIEDEKEKDTPFLLYRKVGGDIADKPLHQLIADLLRKDPDKRPFKSARDVIDYLIKNWPEAARPAKELYGHTIMTTMRL